MKICLIAAVSPDLVIGREGGLPWHYPADMRHFMRTTFGHPCLMGRRTYESMPRRPLPGRPNLVLTRNPDFAAAAGMQPFHDLEAALDHCRQAGRSRVYVCGGASVYAEALPLAREMILTRVPDRVEGDTRFPEWPDREWTVTGESREGPLRFVTYRRR